MPAPAPTTVRPSLVVSDLHLGSASGSDLLRDPGPARDALLGALDGIERLVIAGDLLELRHAPARTVLARARPFLAALGAALGPDRELLVLAGNHDHRMVRPWLQRRRLAGEPLPLDAGADAAEVSPLTAAVADAVGGRSGDGPRVRVAYPAAWLVRPVDDGDGPRGGVLVSHGHYVDAVWRMPTMERLAAAVAIRAHRSRSGALTTPDHFERALGPAYGWMDAMAEYAAASDGPTRSQRTSSGVWARLQSDRSWRGVALRRAVPLAARALTRAGLGPYEHDLTPERLRISGNQGVARAIRQLGARPDALIVGHTHRAGPLPGDAAWEWRLDGGGQLLNCGAWVHTGDGLSATTDRPEAYHAGHAVRVDGDGPRLLDLLG